MKLIKKYNKRTRHLLCGTDCFSKYAWVVPIKDKKVVTIVNAFRNILDNLKRKPNKNGLMKVVSFTTILLKHRYKTVT